MSLGAGAPRDPIALVGIAAQLPGGDSSNCNLDHVAFFEFLMKEGQSYERIPLERFNVMELQGSQPGRIVANRASFLKNIDDFDYLEFGITSKDARAMSVSTRKLIELSFIALFDSGIDYRGRNVGCFASGIVHDVLGLGDMDEFEARGSFAGIPTQIANKISYHLDLVGPSVPTDTACSSTLTAMHLAVQSIRAGDCEAAVVGGCQLNQRFLDFVQYTQGGVLAPDGKCKPFDASADGFSRSEAAVVVVIKPLEDAMRDGDKVYATILGTGINSTGSAAPENAPVGLAQEDAMSRAYKQAGRQPAEVDYIEMHATGTALGDPTEANWVGRGFKRDVFDDSPILVGSVKGNIEHTEIAAFLTSLCKVIGVFENGVIPPNVNLQRLNPAIRWEEYKLHAPVTATPLPTHGKHGRSLISIASSGIGGSNGHCVIEAPPRRVVHDFKGSFKSMPVLLVVGGLSPRAITVLCDSISMLVKEHPSEAAALSVNLGRRVRQMTWRSFAVVDPTADDKITFTQPLLTTRTKPGLGFVFSGQGPQHLHMGRQLFRDFSVFRESVLAMDAVYTKVVGTSLIKSTGLFDTTGGDSALPDIWPINIILPSIAIIQVALIHLLRSFSIAADFVLGHSAGETAMLYACGAASREMTVELSIARGQALALTELLGATMAALSCGPSKAEELLSKVLSKHPRGTLEIACYNTDEAVTVAGSVKLIEELIHLCKSESISAQRLRTNVAVHSSAMDHCEAQFRSFINDVFDRHTGGFLEPNGVQAYSTVSGKRFDDTFNAEYFWKNTRQPVLFSNAMEAIVNDYADRPVTIIEIGAHPVLSSYISSFRPDNMTVLCPMRRTKTITLYHECSILLRAIGGLVTAGHNIVHFSALNGNIDHLLSFTLPSYPFLPRHVPLFSKWMGQQKVLSGCNGPLNHRRLRMNFATHPDLAQHVMNGEPIVPATGFLEMAIEFGATVLWNVKFHSFLSLSQDEPIPVSVTLQGTHWTVSSATSVDPAKTTRLHAEGHLSLDSFSHHQTPVDIPAIRERCQEVNTNGFYDDLRYFAQYGPCFQLIKRFHRGNEEFLVEVDAGRDNLPSVDGYRKQYRLDPAILDACLHVIVHPLITGTTDPSAYYLPSGCGRLFLYNTAELFTDRLFAYGCNGKWTPETISYDILIVNSENTPICTFREMTVSLHAPIKEIAKRYDMIYEPIASLKIPDACMVDSERSLSVFPHSLQESFRRSLCLTFQPGEECHSVQRALRRADLTNLSGLWIFASTGYCAGAAAGFSRALRREVMCPVRLVAFEIDWAEDHKELIAMHLLASGIKEEEVVVTPVGVVLVPRLRPMDAPRATVPFDPSARWCLENTNGGMSLIHASMPILNSNEVRIRIQRVFHNSQETRMWSFVGCTDAGASVVAITGSLLSNVVSTPRGHILAVPHDYPLPLEQVAIYAIPAVILSLTFESRAQEPESLKGVTVLLTHADTVLGSLLTELLQRSGVHLHRLDRTAPLSDVLNIKQKHFDFVISGHTNPAICDVIHNLYATAESLCFWNSEMDGLHSLLHKRQHLISRALQSAMQWLPFTPSSTVDCPMVDAIFIHHQSSNVLPDRSLLFYSNKAYLLIGGIGSLGLQIASWMYENGARYLILTSRSGRDSLVRATNMPALRTLKYLEGLSDLTLVLSSSDAANVDDTRKLIDTLAVPVAGCMLLAAVLEDKPFDTQTQESFSRVFASKIGAYNALNQALDVSKLDFLIGFTSISGMFGNAGQTNYASANTALEFLLQQHDNAFCIVTPMILDTSIAFGDITERTARNTKVRHIAEWGVSSRDLCRFIQDGLRKLKDGAFSLYVPDMNWHSIRNRMGVSPFFAHLVPQDTGPHADSVQASSPSESVLQVLLNALELSVEDFSPEVPLTAYGLDSLSAQRVVSMLRPLVRITQLQLLADMTFNDIITRINSSPPATVEMSPESFSIDWEEVASSDKLIVKLRDGDGVPIFLIPGTSGRVDIFTHISDEFTSPVYGIQMTSTTPETLPKLAEFYFMNIKTTQPRGPYRLGAFCGGSITLFLLAEKILQAGDDIQQMALIDGFPMFYASPVWEIDQITVHEGKASEDLERRSIDFLIDLYLNEPSSVVGHNYTRVAEETKKAMNGERVGPAMRDRFRNIMHSVRAHGKFMTRFANSSETFDARLVRQRLADWISTFKFPITLYLASHGLRSLYPRQSSEWDNLGLELCKLNLSVKFFSSGHFELLSNKEFISQLDRDGRLSEG